MTSSFNSNYSRKHRTTMNNRLNFIIILLVFSAEASIELIKIETCSSSNITLSFETCEIVNNRVNAAVLFWRPVNEIYVSSKIKFFNKINKIFTNFQLKVKLFREVNGDFREIFKFPRFEWCSVMDGTAKTTSMIRTFLNSFKERYPKAIRACPLTGRSELMNATMDKKLVMMFPNGLYRFTIKTHTDDDPRGVFFSILSRNEGN